LNPPEVKPIFISEGKKVLLVSHPMYIICEVSCVCANSSPMLLGRSFAQRDCSVSCS
jgi:hypothetical protein